MSRLIYCFIDTRTNDVFIAPKNDFKEIRAYGGYEHYKVLDTEMCSSKKMEKQYEVKCKNKYNVHK